MQRALHLFVDLSSDDLDHETLVDTLQSLRDDEGDPRFAALRLQLSARAAAASQELLDPAWEVDAQPGSLRAANESMRAAERAGADWMILDGALAPDRSALLALQRVLERDPYFAFLSPRTASFGTHLIEKLDPLLGDPELASIPRSVVDSSAEFLLMPDRIGRATLMRFSVLRDFAPLDESFETLRGALQDLVARARRAGFRSVVVNRAVVSRPVLHEQQRGGWQRDVERLHAEFPETHELERIFREHPVHELESKLGRACSFSSELRQSLLIDLSDMGAIRNGTTESVLGMLRGIRKAGSAWTISLLVPPEAAAYHELEEGFPEFSIVWPEPATRYTAAFRPIQPWSIVGQLALHRLALFNFFFMHDTISSDVFVDAPIRLDDCWALLARSSDGILYNSDFTRERFNLRFPVASGVGERTCRHSLDPGDYGDAAYRSDPGEHIYVVGNRYPHKWLPQTIEHLSAAFPYQELKVLGYEDPKIPRLRGLPSGHLSEADVEALYGRARVVVYPSQYEGFGLPMLRGLSYGKDVVVRRSELVTELANHYRGPGRLIGYESVAELVEGVGRSLHGLPVDTIPLGSSLDPQQAPHSWSDMGREIIDFIEERVSKPDASNWQRRQEVAGGIDAHGAVQRLWASL